MASTAQQFRYGPIFNAGVQVTDLRITHYAAGTTNLKDVYTARDKSATAAQPVLSDSNGIVSFFGDGIYKLLIQDGATVLYTVDNWTIQEPSTVDQTGTNNFRLTLTTGVPVTTTDVTGASAVTIYCTPYNGNQIALYDGVATWNLRSSSEFSIAVPAVADTNYDVFCYDNSTVPTLELLAWTNSTTRATALAYQNGILVKSGTSTRRYLGTFRTTGVAGQTSDSLNLRYLWNYYNRALRTMKRVDTTDSWTYSTNSFQQANNSGSNQIDMVIGYSEDVVRAHVIGQCTNSGATIRAVCVGIGLDSATVNSADRFNQGGAENTNMEAIAEAWYQGYPGIGRHYLAWLERGGGADTQTWYGDGGGSLLQTGIQGEVWG